MGASKSSCSSSFRSRSASWCRMSGVMHCPCGEPWQILRGGLACYACDGRPDSVMRSDLDVFTAVPPTWAVNRMLRNARTTVESKIPPFDLLLAMLDDEERGGA